MVDPVDSHAESSAPFDFRRLNFRKWAWTPLYAKIWWGLAAAYWAIVILSFQIQALSWLKDSVALAYLFVAFHPVIMLFIMAFGTLERWWHGQDRGDWEPSDGDHLRLSDYGPSGLRWDLDPLDPRSPFFGSPGDKIH